MKWGTPDHPKTTHLAGGLGVELYAAVGLLELLWHWTSKYRQDGSLEGVSDHSIAAACRWSGEPERLVRAFVDARWIDLDPMRRVHGWPDHAENAVHSSLARAGMLFCDGTVPKVGHLDSKERPEATRLLALAREEFEAAASQKLGAPGSPEESPRGPRGISTATPRLAVAVALATHNGSTTTPPTPSSGAQKPLALVGLVPHRPTAAASFEDREALRQCIELLVEISGKGSFAWWCREVTSRKLRTGRDYSQARVSLDGISGPCAQRSLMDARQEIRLLQRDLGLTDAQVLEIESRVRRTA